VAGSIRRTAGEIAAVAAVDRSIVRATTLGAIIADVNTVGATALDGNTSTVGKNRLDKTTQCTMGCLRDMPIAPVIAAMHPLLFQTVVDLCHLSFPVVQKLHLMLVHRMLFQASWPNRLATMLAVQSSPSRLVHTVSMTLLSSQIHLPPPMHAAWLSDDRVIWVMALMCHIRRRQRKVVESTCRQIGLLGDEMRIGTSLASALLAKGIQIRRPMTRQNQRMGQVTSRSGSGHRSRPRVPCYGSSILTDLLPLGLLGRCQRLDIGEVRMRVLCGLLGVAGPLGWELIGQGLCFGTVSFTASYFHSRSLKKTDEAVASVCSLPFPLASWCPEIQGEGAIEVG